jgi:mannose-6-phosphate isomerase-like protein (cupin superfamily)
VVPVNGEAYVREPATGTVIAIGPTTNRLLATDAETGGRSSVYEVTVPSGFAGPPPHVHRDRDHAFYVVSGSVRLTVGERSFDATAGTFAYVPAGVPHAFGNPDNGSGVLLVFDTPGGWERYLTELAETFPAGTPVDPVRVAEVMARHDTRTV